MKNLEEYLLKKAEERAKALPSTKTPEIKSKIDITGKPQSLEELMKALGLPIKGEKR